LLLSRVRHLTTPEQLLRALGSLFDRFEAHRIVIEDTPGGIEVSALIPAYLEDGTTEPLDRRFDTPDLLHEVLEGVARRGTGVTAGPLERELRLVGRYLHDNALVSARLVQVADGWIVQPTPADPGVAPHVLDRAALARLEEVALARRRPAEDAVPVVSEGSRAA
jgi:hypothetical protein